MRERRREENIRTTIRAWTVAAEDSKLRKRAFERAEAHAAAVVVHRAATAWRVATRRRARDASRKTRESPPRRSPSRDSDAIEFDAWLERSRVGAIERVQLERADDAFHRRTRRRRFGPWRVFLGVRRRREKITLAISNRNRRSRTRDSRRSSPRWCVVARKRRRTPWRCHTFEPRGRRRVSRRGGVARTTSESLRKLLADAAESHRRWLAPARGCAAWLREGLHRREWCAAEATRVAARTYADALRRAEPYARRWRHKTLGARARRRRILGECAFSGGGCGGASALGAERAPTLPTLPTLPTYAPNPRRRRRRWRNRSRAAAGGAPLVADSAEAARARRAFHARVRARVRAAPRPPRPKPRRPSMDSDDASNGAVVGVDERVTGRERRSREHTRRRAR